MKQLLSGKRPDHHHILPLLAGPVSLLVLKVKRHKIWALLCFHEYHTFTSVRSQWPWHV